MEAPEEVGMETPEERSPEEESSPDGAAPEEVTVPSGLLKNILIAAMLGAGGIHLWAAWAHGAVTRYLVFFVVLAALQLWLAAALIWVPTVPRAVLIAGAVANAATVVIWVLSRTTGVPFQLPSSDAAMDEIMSKALASPGPDRGFMSHGETFGLMDTAATVLEVAFVVGVVLLLRRLTRRAPGDSGSDAAVAGGDPVVGDSEATVSPEMH